MNTGKNPHLFFSVALFTSKVLFIDTDFFGVYFSKSGPQDLIQVTLK